VSALLKLFYTLSPLKIVKTNGATLFFCIFTTHIYLFWDCPDLLGSKSFRYLSVILFEFEQLLISHVISVRVMWIMGLRTLTLLDSSLQQSFFLLFCSADPEHWVHHYLHHYFFFTLPRLLMLHLHCHHMLHYFLLLSFGLFIFIFWRLFALFNLVH